MELSEVLARRLAIFHRSEHTDVPNGRKDNYTHAELVANGMISLSISDDVNFDASEALLLPSYEVRE